MGKIKEIFGNKWVGFTLAALLYTLWFVVWTGTVSYTHLDVYKRQRIISAGWVFETATSVTSAGIVERTNDS